jgi:hypothetical protein
MPGVQIQKKDSIAVTPIEIHPPADPDHITSKAASKVDRTSDSESYTYLLFIPEPPGLFDGSK